MATSYREVVDGLKRLKALGKTKADAEAFASENGWTLGELRKAKDSGSKITDYSAPVLQGVSLGYGDEISAGLRTGFGYLGDYDDALADERAVLKRAQSKAPATSAGLEFAGALAPGIASAPLSIGRTLLGTVAKSAGSGAGLGAAYGFGAGEGEGRVEGAVSGGLVGGVLGGALPIAGEALKAAGRGVAGVVAPKTAAKAEIKRAIARDGMTPASFAQRARDVDQGGGPAAMLADAGGENVKGLLERVANTPGVGRNKVVPALESRQKGQLQRIATGLQNLTGTKQGAFEAIDQSIKRAKQTALPFKQKAMMTDITGDEPLQAFIAEMVKRPSGKKALAKARRMAADKGRAIADDGPYSMQDADLLFRGLNDVIEDNTKIDPLGRSTVSQVGQGVLALKDKFRNVLDPVVPDYAEFRKLWSGEAAFRSAASKGKSVTRMSSDEMADYLKRASASEREGFTIGAVSELSARMGNNSAKLPDLTKVMRSPEMRKKIDMLLPDDESRKAFANAFDFEEGVSEITRQTTGNSRTAARLAEEADRQTGDLVMDIATEGASPGASMLRRLLGTVAGGVRDTVRSRTDDQIADVLLSPNQASLDALLAAQTRAPFYGQLPGRVSRGSAPAIAGLTLPDARPSGPLPY